MKAAARSSKRMSINYYSPKKFKILVFFIIIIILLFELNSKQIEKYQNSAELKV